MCGHLAKVGLEKYVFIWNVGEMNIDNRFIKETYLSTIAFSSKYIFPAEAFISCFIDCLRVCVFLFQINCAYKVLGILFLRSILNMLFDDSNYHVYAGALHCQLKNCVD